MLNPGDFHALRKGEIRLIRQTGRLAVLGKCDSALYHNFVKEHEAFIEGHVLLLPEIAQLSKDLNKVPELSWDIIEFSVKELEIIFKEGRHVPDFFLRQDKKLAIRTVLNGKFHQMLYNLGRPLGLTKLSSSFPEVDPLEQQEIVLNLPDNFEWKLKPGKRMSLGINGEVKFYDD